jgi:hypothetical protein
MGSAADNRRGGCFLCLRARSRPVCRDKVKAVLFLDKACNMGEAPACFNLGAMYDKGEGVAINKQRAMQLYQNACSKGDGSGCFNIGTMYALGEGVAADNNKAVQFFDLSCRKGNAKGCDFAKELATGLRKK